MITSEAEADKDELSYSSMEEMREAQRTVVLGGLLRGDVEQVGLAEFVLAVTRIELDDLLDSVVRRDIEGERL